MYHRTRDQMLDGLLELKEMEPLSQSGGEASEERGGGPPHKKRGGDQEGLPPAVEGRYVYSLGGYAPVQSQHKYGMSRVQLERARKLIWRAPCLAVYHRAFKPTSRRPPTQAEQREKQLRQQQLTERAARQWKVRGPATCHGMCGLAPHELMHECMMIDCTVCCA